MRIIFILLLLIIFSPICLADDSDAVGGWDTYGKDIDKAFTNTKPVTKELFDKTIQDIKARKNKKKKKNEITPLSPIPFKEDTYDQNEMQSLYKKMDHTPTIMIPTDSIADNGAILHAGYYKLSNQKGAGNKYYLVFSQGNSTIARNEANQTEEDYNQKDINFVDVIPISDKYLKIIYGTIDLNLETFLEIKSLKSK